MKISTNEVKNGTVIQHNNKLLKVIDHSHTHTGRGGGTYTFRVKDIITGGTQNLTFKSGQTLEAADVQYTNAIYLYQNGETYTFMETDTSEMHELMGDIIETELIYLKDNLDVFLIKHDGQILGIILPQTITYIVAETVPGVKGDRAQAGKKPATLENGLEVSVPLHIDAGQEVTINTATGDVK